MALVDVLTRAQRSYNMSRIRAKNTRPEMKIRSLLFKMGLRGYRIHYGLAGKPDLVFTRERLAVFIDGCFWHKCPVDFKEPETRKAFWMKKVERNVMRDRKVTAMLRKDGWYVLRFWEHEVRKKPDGVVSSIRIRLSHTPSASPAHSPSSASQSES